MDALALAIGVGSGVALGYACYVTAGQQPALARDWGRFLREWLTIGSLVVLGWNLVWIAGRNP